MRRTVSKLSEEVEETQPGNGDVMAIKAGSLTRITNLEYVIDVFLDDPVYTSVDILASSLQGTISPTAFSFEEVESRADYCWLRIYVEILPNENAYKIDYIRAFIDDEHRDFTIGIEELFDENGDSIGFHDTRESLPPEVIEQEAGAQGDDIVVRKEGNIFLVERNPKEVNGEMPYHLIGSASNDSAGLLLFPIINGEMDDKYDAVVYMNAVQTGTSPRFLAGDVNAKTVRVRNRNVGVYRVIPVGVMLSGGVMARYTANDVFEVSL